MSRPDPSPADLLSFRQSLRSCTRCPIHSNTGGPIPWHGPLRPRYAILGEAPGSEEAKQGQPFVGSSGAILRHWLRQVDINPSEIAFLNSAACWPGRRSSATPTRDELQACRPWVHGQLEFIQPEVVITLGVVAFHQLRDGLPRPKLAALHGKPYKHPVYGFWCWSSYHPAAYLRGRNKHYEKKILDDLRELRSWEAEGEHLLEECYICGDELYRYDEYAIGLCYRHAQHQGVLFAEDVIA